MDMKWFIIGALVYVVWKNNQAAPAVTASVPAPAAPILPAVPAATPVTAATVAGFGYRGFGESDTAQAIEELTESFSSY
jgi:hypothetical protein